MKGDINISPVNLEDRKALGIKAGDTVRVWVKIQEKGKTRLQAFEGMVLAMKHGAEAGATFTVRKVSLGVGVERIFPLYSPNIDKIEIVKRANVRRAKLYHIRDKVARGIKRQMRKMKMVNLSSLSDGEETDRIAKESAEEKARIEAEEKKAAAQQQKILNRTSAVPVMRWNVPKKSVMQHSRGSKMSLKLPVTRFQHSKRRSVPLNRTNMQLTTSSGLGQIHKKSMSGWQFNQNRRFR